MGKIKEKSFWINLPWISIRAKEQKERIKCLGIIELLIKRQAIRREIKNRVRQFVVKIEWKEVHFIYLVFGKKVTWDLSS